MPEWGFLSIYFRFHVKLARVVSEIEFTIRDPKHWKSSMLLVVGMGL